MIKVKQYIVNAGDTYYPLSWNYKASFDNLEYAKHYCDGLVASDSTYEYPSYDWAEVIDLATMRDIYSRYKDE